jgi:membrane protein
MAANAFARWKKFQQDARAFFEETGLQRPGETLSSWPFRFAHFWLLVGKSFARHRCPLRASALAFTTLLALIPMLAVVLSVATSILKNQGDAPIRTMITKLVEHVTPYTNPGDMTPEDRETARQAREKTVQTINEAVNRVQTGTIGTISMVVLVFMAISMLTRIEDTFNDIWGAPRGRSWYARVVLYWAAVSLGPLLLVVAAGLTSGPHFETTKRLVMGMPFVGGLLFRLLPVAVLCLLFALLYLLMPNTRVKWSAALAGGLVGGLLWHLNNYLGVLFVSRVGSNNAIYGSLGALPVFMIGLYFAWLILLFGAQVAYAWQNREAYLQDKLAENVSPRGREFTALRVMTRVARLFQAGEKPPSTAHLAHALGVPSRLVSQVVSSLIRAGLLFEVADRETGYSPARPLDRINLHDILMAVRCGQGQDPATTDEPERALVRQEADRVADAERQAAALTLAEFIGRAEK